MDLSRKLFVAACACVACLAAVASCTVEDRDINEKGVFGCYTDDDCTGDNVCADAINGLPGRCMRPEDVKHCHDYDQDGAYAADPGYADKCNFDPVKNPEDPDDYDDTVHPGATEYCDGKDNSVDGCVDGTCTLDSGDCRSNPGACQPLYETCFGNSKIEDNRGSVCDAETVGAMFCNNGTWTYGTARLSGNIYSFTQSSGTCPDATASGYVENELSEIRDNEQLQYCDGRDHDCNGLTGLEEGAEYCSTECKVDAAAKYCTVSGSIRQTGNEMDIITILEEQCDINTDADDFDMDDAISKCGCIGTPSCETAAGSEVSGRDPVCVKSFTTTDEATGDVTTNRVDLVPGHISEYTPSYAGINWNCE